MIKRTIGICLALALIGPKTTPVCTAQDKIDRKPEVAQSVTQNETMGKQAYLGLGVIPLQPAIASQLGNTIGDGRGVLIANVVEGSPAAKAGLKIHDVLVALNQQDIYSTEQLVKLIQASKPGEEVALTFFREGKQQKASLVLGEIIAQPTDRTQKVLRVPFDERFPIPELFSRDRLLENIPDAGNWSQFESLSIAKDEDGNYKAKISFKDNEQTLDRTFIGTREEVVKAIEEDKELPKTARDHLLRGLDVKIHVRELFDPEQFFRRPGLSKEMFNWPEFEF